MVERRVFERFPVSLAARLLDTDTSQEAEAMICDLSAKGVCIACKEYLRFGDSLELWITMPDKKEPFYTRGTLAWTRTQGLKGYVSGISLERAEFMGMSRVFRGER